LLRQTKSYAFRRYKEAYPLTNTAIIIEFRKLLKSQNRTDVKALLAVYGLEQFALSAAVHPSEKKIIN
jgi:hypothetical protein